MSNSKKSRMDFFDEVKVIALMVYKGEKDKKSTREMIISRYNGDKRLLSFFDRVATTGESGWFFIGFEKKDYKIIGTLLGIILAVTVLMFGVDPKDETIHSARNLLALLLIGVGFTILTLNDERE